MGPAGTVTTATVTTATATTAIVTTAIVTTAIVTATSTAIRSTTIAPLSTIPFTVAAVRGAGTEVRLGIPRGATGAAVSGVPWQSVLHRRPCTVRWLERTT